MTFPPFPRCIGARLRPCGAMHEMCKGLRLRVGSERAKKVMPEVLAWMSAGAGEEGRAIERGLAG